MAKKKISPKQIAPVSREKNSEVKAPLSQYCAPSFEGKGHNNPFAGDDAE